ncbi:helix-turn-helix domain-containing protein [Mucilaginibacter sp. McL0603]|jgi:excisionase family DNA binding protein|uniref:helix-turn-helix domain-containing protein n=1 Tax=Mucilaginibacter sp. McL0603 TaxID=3415670 RepID=UPI003CF54578
METITFDQLPQAVSKLQDKLESIEQLLLRQQEQQPSLEELMPITQAAQFLDLAVPTVYSKVCRKEIPVNKRGKRLYFYRSELTEWIKSGRKKTADEIREEAVQQLGISRKGSKTI